MKLIRMTLMKYATISLFAYDIISGLETVRHDLSTSNIIFRKAFRLVPFTDLKLANAEEVSNFNNVHSSDIKLNGYRSLLTLRGGSDVPNGLLVSQTIGDVVAKLLGYVMGLGAVAVYLPIVIKLLKSKDAKGMSLQTWICNLLGLSMAVLYPFKKGFPLSTYIELVTISIQSVFILFLVCLFNNQVTQFLIGISIFSAAAATVAIADIPANVLNVIQLLSILICNYANIPQILLTVKNSNSNFSMPMISHLSNYNFIL